MTSVGPQIRGQNSFTPEIPQKCAIRLSCCPQTALILSGSRSDGCRRFWSSSYLTHQPRDTFPTVQPCSVIDVLHCDRKCLFMCATKKLLVAASNLCNGCPPFSIPGTRSLVCQGNEHGVKPHRPRSSFKIYSSDHPYKCSLQLL